MGGIIIKAVDGVVHLLLVEIGDLAEHLVQDARLLADGGHLDRHVGKQVALPHGQLQGLAGGLLLAHLKHRLLIGNRLAPLVAK